MNLSLQGTTIKKPDPIIPQEETEPCTFKKTDQCAWAGPGCCKSQEKGFSPKIDAIKPTPPTCFKKLAA